jgi:hypothetical protein
MQKLHNGTPSFHSESQACMDSRVCVRLFLIIAASDYLYIFRDVVRDNSLINMSGCDGHYHGVDKNAETNINFQKVSYAVQYLIPLAYLVYRIS